MEAGLKAAAGMSIQRTHRRPPLAQLVFASCAGPALSPFVRNWLYCVSTGELTRGRPHR